jgi:CRP-like cAMP-binding protein
VEAGNPLTHVYLPHSGVISMLVRLSEGQTVEVAMVGHDSVFGASAALDGGMSLTVAVRLSAGHSLHSRYCGVSGDRRSQRCPSGPAGAP